MTFITRTQEYEEVRRRLDYPLIQRPNGELIASELIATEQSMFNRLGAQGAKGWTKKSTTIATVSGTSEYTVTPSAGSKVGKVLFAFRDLGNNILLPIDFTDFGAQILDQKHSFFTAPVTSGVPNSSQGYKISLWRDGATQKVRIHPVPEEVMTITLVYAAGQIDWSTWAWADTPALPEWSFLRVLYTSVKLLSRTGWEDSPRAEWPARRAELRADLTMQIAQEEPRFEAYIRNPSGENISDIEDWYN
jgi:hypothetical protein